MILTGLFGAVSGVGIWFAIGLANPEGTSTLIHNFVFGWAIEWVFFLVELSTAAVYYYTWGRVSRDLHLKIGYLYAVASFCTLAIINGILTFMLTPGDTWLGVAGTGQEASKFWNAFFNPTYWPSLFLRTLVCITLAGLWALVTMSRLDGEKDGATKTALVRWSTMWLMPAYILMPVCFLWYLSLVPEAHRALLDFGISTIGQGTFTQVTRTALISIMSSATILGVVYFMAYRNPRDFGFGHACAIMVVALMATGSTEQAREMLRKPYVVGEHMYSNSVRVSEVKRFNELGYLTNSPWVREGERKAWVVSDSSAAAKIQKVSTADGALTAPTADTLARGRLMFAGQCLACHTEDGYRSMKRLLRGRDLDAIRNVLGMLNDTEKESPYRSFMPPLVGTKDEVEALAQYLNNMANPPAAVEPAATAVETAMK